jgi:hypothetical protein
MMTGVPEADGWLLPMEFEATMKKSIRLCLGRGVLSASLALLSACDEDAPGKHAASAAEDASTPDDMSTTEDPATSQDASMPEHEPEPDDASEPEHEPEPDDAGAIEDAGSPRDPQFLPWQEGNTWTYRVTNNGTVSTKVVTVMAEEAVGGDGPHADELAFKVVTRKGERDQTVSWQALRGDVVVRFREQSFHAGTGALEQEEHWSPYKLHFDGSAAHTMAGASWFEAYEETKQVSGAAPETSGERDRWIVDSPEEKVTVPAGTFRAVVVMKASGSDLKTYWYVRGVGKVKETGGQTEELVSYEIGE